MGARERIEQAGIFAGLAPDELRALLAVGESGEATAGHVFLRTGEATGALWVIGSGAVRVERRVGEEDVPLATLEAGQSFGEMSLLDAGPSSASVVAAEATEFVRLAHDRVLEVLAARPAIAARFWRNVALELKRRLAQANNLVASYVDINRALLHDPSFREYYSRL